MDDQILDKEEKELEESKGKKRISGLMRFALILYLFYNTYLALPTLLVFAGEPIGIYIAMALIFISCWYNLRQGKSELTNKLINQNSFIRYSSVFTFVLFILFYIGVFINRLNNSIGIIDIIFILSILAFLIYRDIFEIPKEIKQSNFKK